MAPEGQRIREAKHRLLTSVCAMMIRESRYDEGTVTTGQIAGINRLAAEVAKTSPEFLLKLALYVRADLNIRATSNYLAAFAAVTPACAPYLRAYIPRIIVLPTDWVQVAQFAELWLTVRRKNAEAATKGLPTSLRKALVDKFPDFSAYQLAKHDKEKGMLRKKQKDKKRKRQEVASSPDALEELDDQFNPNFTASGQLRGGDDSDDALTARVYTIKRLIRSLHVEKPVYHVMCITGQRYPTTEGEFEKTGLAATHEFDGERAGKRMKLDVPDTWEVMLAKEGNTADTWEKLLDMSPPLPFMAMVRNIRNFILSGISAAHHKKVQDRLRNPEQVTKSRLFPYRFFSAYEAIRIDLGAHILKATQYVEEQRLLEAEKKKAKGSKGAGRAAESLADLWGKTLGKAGKGAAPKPEAPPAMFAGKGKGKGKGKDKGKKGSKTGKGGKPGKAGKAGAADGEQRRLQKVIVPKNIPTPDVIESYADALDTAVRHATTYNIKPIYGKTLVLCNAKEALNAPITAASSKGIGSVRTLRELSILLALMLKYGCEDCDIYLYDSDEGGSAAIANLQDGTILRNLQAANDTVLQMRSTGKAAANLKFPFDVLNGILSNETWVDNLIVIDDSAVGDSGQDFSDENPLRNGGLSAYVKKMRQLINPDLFYISVDIAGGGGCKLPSDATNDAYVTGFSDSILRFVAERGAAQLEYVERIDEVKRVKKDKVNFEMLAGPRVGGKGCAGDAEEEEEDEESEETEEKPSVGPSDEEEAEEEEEYEENETAARSQSHMQSHMGSLAVTSTDGASGGWATIRVFISSTFLDMQTERHLLSTEVFPTLRRWCAARGYKIRLVDIDLRWGITSQDADNGLSTSLCLNEVERCKPFFIGLVGDRYGHTPSSYNVSVDEINSRRRNAGHCFDWLGECPPGKSVTELEMLHAALGVNPGRHNLFYFRKQEALIPTVPPKFQANYKAESPAKAAAVADLKARIEEKAASGEVVLRRYDAKYNADTNAQRDKHSGDLTGLDGFVKQVTADLWGVIQDCVQDDVDDQHDDLQLWRSHHGHALSSKAAKFAGRRDTVSSVLSWMQGRKQDGQTDPNMLLVTGEEGMGKSTCAAAVARRYSKTAGSDFLLPHFVGCCPGSRHPHSVLSRLAREFAGIIGDGRSVPEAFDELIEGMPTLIQDVGRVSKMIVVLDGIDYMEPADLAMRALPTLLPTQRGVSPVRFVVTATPRSAAHAALLKRNPPPQVVSLGEVDAADRKDIVTKALAPYGKKLGTRWGGKISAGSVLVRKPDARLPEYLAVGVAYLRTTVSHAQLLPAVRSLPPTLPKLHDFIFETCEHRCGGKPPVSAVVAPLALSAPTGGLTEVQLRVFTGLPTATIESILTHLSVYLYTDPTGGKFTLSSSAMLKAAKRRYCSSKAEESTMHRKLGMFHLTGVNPPGGKLFGLSDAAVNWLQAEDNSVRGVLYHSVEAGAWEILSRCAADVGFFECLAVHGMVPEGLSALRLAVASGKVVGKKLTPFADFLEKNGQVITLHPQLAVQAVRNSTFGGPVHQLAAAAEVTVPWFQREDLQLAAPLCASTRHTGSPVAALAMSKDGRFVAVGTRDWKIRVILQRDSKQRFLLTRHTSVVTVLNFTPGNDGLVSGSADGAVFLWSMRDGAVLLHLPAAHAKTVHGVCFGKASDYFATCSDDTTVKVWDVTHQRCIKTYREHTGPVSCIRSHVEGRLFASGAWDTTLKLYAGINTDTFYLATLHTGLKAISDVCWLPSLVPMVAAASCDGKVRVFDVNAQAPFITIDGHYGRTVRSITYSPDGKWMISGDAQGCVKVWRSSTGEEIAACTGHHKGVRKVLVAPDNKTLLTGAADSQVRSWNRENSATQTLHSARVTQCALHQGRLAFSSSRDGTLKVVDLAEGATASSAAGKSAASAGSQKRGGASFLTIAHAKEGASDSVAPPPLPVTSFAVSHDGTRVVTASIDGLIRAFKVAPGLGGSHSGHAPFLIFKGHRNVVSGVYVNKANELFSVSWDCSIRKWALTAGRAGEMPGEAAGDVTTTAVLCVKRDAHSMEISGVRGTAEGDTIATTSFDQTIRVWSCGNLAHVRTLCAHTNWTTAVAYHPSDPALLATGGLDGRVCLWDLSKPSDEALCWETFATNLTTLTGAESSVHAVQFLNDELLLVAADPGVLAWKVTPSFSGVSGKLTCADAPAGVFFTEAPCVSLAAAVNAAGAFQVWCGDVIGTTYNLTLRDLAGEWSVRELQLHVASDVPHAVARRDGESQMEVDSEEGASTCEMESYTTWETVSDAEIFPGRGGCFKKFASGAARRQYLMNARKEYVEGLKAMKKGQRPQPSPACQEYFNQSVKTMEVISMLQNLGVV